MPRLRVSTVTVAGVSRYDFQTIDGQSYLFYPTAGARPVSLIIAGDLGNQFAWSSGPVDNNVGYLNQLYQTVGIKILRENFDADNYLSSAPYRASILAYARNVQAAGMYPIISPQDFPSGATQADRITLFYRLITQLADDFKNLPVMLEAMNEPHVLGAWSTSERTVMVEAVRIIREIDPNAFVIVPTEGYGNGDTSGLAQDPITEYHVDLYDYHPYGLTESTLMDGSHAGPMIRANLPVLMGEYGCNGADTASIHSQNLGFQNINRLYPNLLAIGAWAWARSGQDACNLIDTVEVAGSSTTLGLGVGGAQNLSDYHSWDLGTLLR